MAVNAAVMTRVSMMIMVQFIFIVISDQ
jgi:hypothetical protein